MSNQSIHIHCYISSRLNSQLVLLVFLVLLLPFDSYAAGGPPPASAAQCKSKWTVANANGTTGMYFGDFAIKDSTSGTITLNPGSTRTESPSIDLISAGGIVSAHQIVIDNTKDQVVCPTYGIEINWGAGGPEGLTMSGPAPGPAIPISSVKVYIEGVETSLPTPYVTTYTLPLNIVITSTMTTGTAQDKGTYTLPTAYEIGVTQQGEVPFSASVTGTASTIAFTPVEITPGQNMDFGTIASGSVQTVVSVDASGGVTAPAGTGNAVVTIPLGAALQFNIKGDSSALYNLSISDGALDTTGFDGAMALTITGDDRPATLTTTAQTVTVTADLTVGANQPAGSYSTSKGAGQVITVQLDYN